ncbi:MAG TPA: hypothetical protein DCS93_38740 [Microscillaceae bacterium]|nr:hypothetical protein [Microscillaceae bacterium]
MNKNRKNETGKMPHTNGQAKSKNINKKKGLFNKKKDRKDQDREQGRERKQDGKPAKFKSGPGNYKKNKYKDNRGERSFDAKNDRKSDHRNDQKNGRNSQRGGSNKNAFQKKQDQKTKRETTPPNYNLQKPESRSNGRTQKGRGQANKTQPQSDKIRLNRFIANSGVCSRREADKLIEMGLISVNGKVITEMGYQVSPSDVIKYRKRVLKREKFVYVLLNKPKDYITTTNDPQDRKTVMDLVKNSCDERIYPVGRLDRNTTGLLLFTNDGEVAKKLSHPSHDVKKVYQVELDKPLEEEDFDKIAEGVILEDGYAAVDEIAVLNPERTLVGVEIHIGRNRIVRRIFAHLGYEVMKLDRTMYAGINKKDIGRGDWRYLSEKEVIRLKYFA